MNSTCSKNLSDRSLHIGVSLNERDIQFLGKSVIDNAIEIIAARLAEEYIKEHGRDVLAKLDPQAIANLAIAQSGAAIRKTLEEKLPSTERVVEKAVVYQRGIFGGIRRI